MTVRTDIHRPSAINPADYEFVSHDYIGPATDLGFAAFLQAERARFQAHRTRTGGTFSDHAHGGSCHVCGASAFYIAKFYHAKTNTYIVTGEDCAEKMHLGDPARFRAFRQQVHVAREIEKLHQKAREALRTAGVEAAWEIFQSTGGGFEEHTVRDIVGTLVRNGSLTERQFGYVKFLLDKIAARKPVEAASAPVPVTPARVKIEGVIISTKHQETPYGTVLKMLVKADAGFKVWGTVPAVVRPYAERNTRVAFEAYVEPSKDDPNFGFFSRPSNAQVFEGVGS